MKGKLGRTIINILIISLKSFIEMEGKLEWAIINISIISIKNEFLKIDYVNLKNMD